MKKRHGSTFSMYGTLKAAGAMLLSTVMLLPSCTQTATRGGTQSLTSVTTTNTQGNTPGGDNTKSQPNIIYLLMDDTGISDLGCYGNTFCETPNIDKIASEGTVFSNYYTQPVCSPSRSCMMTGQGTLRTGITNFLPDPNSNYLNAKEFTLLPQLLSDNGYSTALLGKWHLCAGYTSTKVNGAAVYAGWDDILMSEQKYIGGGDYFYPYYHLPQVTDGKNGDYLVDVMNERACDYIKEASEKDEPFFLFFSHYATHTTLDAPQETIDYFQKKRGTACGKNEQDRNSYLAAMLKHIDDGVGMIDKLLDELGIADNTIFIISADNGGSLEFTTNGIYRGGKSQIYDGGLRDPMIIRRGAGGTGVTTDYTASVMDIYQTFAELAGVPADKIPANSGTSWVPLLNGETKAERDSIHWAYPKNTGTAQSVYTGGSAPFQEGGAVRVGDYKYMESFAYNRRELYNIKTDPGENKNIIDENPELYRELAIKLNTLLKRDLVGKVFSATFAASENYRFVKSGAFNKTDGAFKASGSGVSTVTIEDFLYYDGDFNIDVTVGDTGKAGLLFRTTYLSGSNSAFAGYAASVDAEHNLVELRNIKGGASYAIASESVDIEANKAYKLRVVTDSDMISVYLDGKLILTAYDESYLKGSFGLYSESCSASSLDNLTVTGLASTRPMTEKQMNIKPVGKNNMEIDGHWLYTATQPVWDGTELYARADNLCEALGVKLTYANDKTEATLVFGSTTLKIKTGSTQAQLNGRSFTLGAAPKANTAGDGMLLPTLTICAAFGFTASSAENNGIVISTSMLESVTYTSSRIKYSGTWSEVANLTKRASEKGAYAELTFTGTGIKLYLDRGNLACIFEVYIDGQLISTIDAYNPSSISRSLMFEKYDLEAGEHTIKVVNTGTHGAASSGTNLNITEFGIIKAGSTDSTLKPLPKTKTVNFDSTEITYNGAWSVAGLTNRSKVAGEFCELSFKGTGIQVYMGVGTGAGIFEVYIDGALAKTVDGYNAAGAATLMLYENNALAAGDHTVKLVNTGTKNAAGTATNMNLANFVISE